MIMLEFYDPCVSNSSIFCWAYLAICSCSFCSCWSLAKFCWSDFIWFWRYINSTRRTEFAATMEIEYASSGADCSLTCEMNSGVGTGSWLSVMSRTRNGKSALLCAPRTAFSITRDLMMDVPVVYLRRKVGNEANLTHRTHQILRYLSFACTCICEWCGIYL